MTIIYIYIYITQRLPLKTGLPVEKAWKVTMPIGSRRYSTPHLRVEFCCIQNARSSTHTSCGGCSSCRVSSCIAVSAANHDFNDEADPSLANDSREFLAMDGQLFGGNSDVINGLVCAPKARFCSLILRLWVSVGLWPF